MIAWTASLQPLVIAALLAITGVMKLRGNAERARQTALGRLVGQERAAVALRSVGGLELCVAAALLLPLGRAAAAGAGTLLAAGFLGYLWYAKVAAPESDCGCTGAGKERVTWRSFARAGLLGVLSVLALGGALAMPSSAWWGQAVIAAPLTAAGLALVELAAFGALTPEYDRYWLMPMRQLKVQLTHPLADTAGAEDTPSLTATLQQLELSEAFRQAGAMIASDVRDTWDEGEWRIIEYAARVDGSPATAVFAVPLTRYDPDAVRVAFVDETRDEPVTAQA